MEGTLVKFCTQHHGVDHLQTLLFKDGYFIRKLQATEEQREKYVTGADAHGMCLYLNR